MIPISLDANSALLELVIGNKDSLASMSLIKENDEKLKIKKKIEERSREIKVTENSSFPFLGRSFRLSFRVIRNPKYGWNSMAAAEFRCEI